MDKPDPFDEAMYDDAIILFDEYLTFMENFLETEAQEHVKNLENLRHSLQMSHSGGPPPEEEYGRFYLGMLDGFADILRKSFFVNLYGACVTKLEKECKKLEQNGTPRFNKFPGNNFLERAEGFFKEVVRIQFPFESPEWKEILNYRVLRNCIVHNNSQLNDNDDILESYIVGKKNLHLTYGSEFSLSKDFCEEALQTVDKFLRLMFFPK